LENPTIKKEENFYNAMGHEIRRKIIKIVGDNEAAGFSTFKTETNSSTGTIYHHLDILSQLLFQDKKKKYRLTTLGQHAYRFLSQNLDSIESIEATEKIQSKLPSKKPSDLLLLKRLFQVLLDEPIRGWIFSFLIIFTIGLICAFNNIQVYLFFYSNVPSTLSQGLLYSPLVILLGALLGFLILFILSEGLCRIFFDKSENWQGLLGILGIAYVPMLLYLLIMLALTAGDVPNMGTIGKIFLILFQIWSMILLSYGISVTKYIRFERGLIISIFIDYGTFMLMLIINVSFL
jgi:hypothetical protein